MLRAILLAVIACLSLPHGLSAQDFNDPYSTYGIGNIQNKEFTHRVGAKSLGLIHQEKASYSLQNPASYAHLRYTTFNMGLDGKIFGHKRQDSSYQDNRIGFDYLTLGFPIMKEIGWGASFGIIPFTEVGYRQAFEPESNLNYEVVNSGDGGITKFYLGNGFQVTSNLTLGFNIGYLFGQIERSNIRDFKQAERFLNSRKVTSRQFGDFIFEGGLQYNYEVNEDYQVLVGAKGRIPKDINYNVNQTTFTYPNNPNTSFERLRRLGAVDTVAQTDDETRNMSLPGSYKSTIAVEKANAWKVGVGLSYEQWSDLQIGDINQNLGDQTAISLNGELLPTKESLSNYAERMSFRFGIKYAKSYLRPTGEKLNRYELQVGTSFPITQDQSNVNLGLAVGQLGKDANNLYRERFFRFQLGLNLNEQWFQTRKVR